MELTKLSSILNRGNRHQKIRNQEDVDKVLDIDEAIRSIRRITQLPWSLKKTNLRIFGNVYQYPISSDHDELSYLDQTGRLTTQNRANFLFTSLQQFIEDKTYRNTLAEIFDNGTKYLGVNYKDYSLPSTDIQETTYIGIGDCTSVTPDDVFFYNDNWTPSNSQSLKMTVVNSTNVATLQATYANQLNTDYNRNYFFAWVYLGGNITSVNLRVYDTAIGANYLEKTGITTQFAGQAIQTNSWNLFAFDLNTATVSGTITGNFMAYDVTLNSAATGDYYVDIPSFKQWRLMDYWYYSKYSIVSSTSTVPDKEFFYNDSTGQFNNDDSLIGDKEWADVIGYDFQLTALSEIENDSLKAEIKSKRNEAWDSLLNKYPSMNPIIITSSYDFENNIQESMLF